MNSRPTWARPYLRKRDLEARAPVGDSLVCRRWGRTVGDAVKKMALGSKLTRQAAS